MMRYKIFCLIFLTILLCTPFVKNESILFADQPVILDVPEVYQDYAMLCGPTCIEMIFRYWGIDKYDKYDITYNILLEFKDEGRYKDCTMLNKRPVVWSDYPGTGTSTMREFLKLFASVENKRIREVPTGRLTATASEFFDTLKNHLKNGIPVIVHQYSKEIGEGGHYRVVTGYDDDKEIVYLNDPSDGRLEWGYDKFLRFWNVYEDWLPFNSIAFNTNKKRNLHLQLKKFDRGNVRNIGEYVSVKKETAETVVIKKRIIAIINSIKPEYIVESWNKRTNSYLPQLQAAEKISEIGYCVEVFEDYLRWSAFKSKQDWKERRKAWMDELQSAENLKTLKGLILEFEQVLNPAALL